MKKQLGYLVLATCAIALQGCDNMLGTSDAEDHKLIPVPVSGLEGLPRPSENAAVITTDGSDIIDATGEPILMRGANLQFGDAPLDRMGGISAISEVGSNVIRLQLRETTTALELEAALLQVVENDMIAIVSLWEPDLACSMDEQKMISSFNNLWMGTWLPILVQDRFQPHIMLNFASQWGPTEIFNAHSLGYGTYIDHHKAMISIVRRVGFAVPIVIDAPGCGQDFNAFLGSRGRSLFETDDERNIVLSVHGYGSRWYNGDSVTSSMRLLERERLPIVMSEFGGTNVGDDSVKHMDILAMGAGDYAASLPITWQTEDDKAGYIATLNAPIDLTGREVSMDVYLDAGYAEAVVVAGMDAKYLGVQMYLRDAQDRYANLGWNSADAMNTGNWTKLKRVIQDNSSYGYAEEGFDTAAVAKIGVELVANGKAVEVGGDIRIDNIKVIEASVPEVLGTWTFDADVEGWVTGWAGTEVSYQDGALGLVVGADTVEFVAESASIPGVVLDGAVQISARVFIPESYEAETTEAWLKFINNGGAKYQDTNTYNLENLTFGEWNELTFSGEWVDGSKIGIHMGGFIGSVEPILFDDIVLVGMPEEQSAVEWGVQYQSDFNEDTDGFAFLTWDHLPATVTAEEGVLVVTPHPSEVGNPPTDREKKFAIRKEDWGSVEDLDLTSELVTMSFTVQLDPVYANAPDDFRFKLFMQDSKYENHFDIGEWTIAELTPGEWVSFEVDVEFPAAFDRSGTPQNFGFQVLGLYDLPDAPIKISDFRIEGDVPLEVEEDVVELIDFHYPAHFDTLSVDFVEGGLDAMVLLEQVESYQRSKPFNWIAWSWIGNPEGMETLDMSFSEDTSVDLTERGEQIINGKGGIMETSVPVNFPAVP